MGPGLGESSRSPRHPAPPSVSAQTTRLRRWLCCCDSSHRTAVAPGKPHPRYAHPANLSRWWNRTSRFLLLVMNVWSRSGHSSTYTLICEKNEAVRRDEAEAPRGFQTEELLNAAYTDFVDADLAAPAHCRMLRRRQRAI